MKKEHLLPEAEDLIMPGHAAELDGTGMYPMKKRINIKSFIVALLLPAALIHILSFWALYASFRRPGPDRPAAMTLVSLLPLVLSSLYLFMARRPQWSRSGMKFFTRYERGRRFVIGLVISFAAAGGFLYFVVAKWHILTLGTATMLLAFCLLCGNVILTYMPYELASYIMFGVLTWLVSVVSFSVFDGMIKLSPLSGFAYSWTISQTGSFILCVLFAFVTNRVFVFTQKGSFMADMLKFFGSRIVSTLVFEVGAMYILINLLHVDNVISKFVGAFLVTIANYFLSKFFVFRGGEALAEEKDEGSYQL